jgi:hypothetical protein
MSVSMGLSEKRCSKCSKLAEKLREIEALLNSGQVEKAREVVVEMVNELKRDHASIPTW